MVGDDSLINEIASFSADEVNKIVAQLESEGFIAAGHNGPYFDKDTPARVTAHWIQVCEFLYKKTYDSVYLDYIDELARYLMSFKAGSESSSYLCRTNDDKDKVNGLIGPAWIIEGLLSCYRMLEKDLYLEDACALFKQHPFDNNFGAWKYVDIDGKTAGFDNTYNHQLWFAAAGSQILEHVDDDEISSQVDCFLINSESSALLRVSGEGRIKHFSQTLCCGKRGYKWKLRSVLDSSKSLINQPSMRYKELGYHCFNMYAFALIHKRYPSHSFFSSEKFNSALELVFSEKYFASLLDCDASLDVTGLAGLHPVDNVNIYGYPYNVPGFELPFISDEFDVNSALPEKALKKQLELFPLESKPEKVLMDYITYKSRIYELLRAL